MQQWSSYFFLKVSWEIFQKTIFHSGTENLKIIFKKQESLEILYQWNNYDGTFKCCCCLKLSAGGTSHLIFPWKKMLLLRATCNFIKKALHHMCSSVNFLRNARKLFYRKLVEDWFGLDYCTTSLNNVWTQILLMFKSSS